MLKTYTDVGNLFFEPGFSNFKREKTLISIMTPKKFAKSEFMKILADYVKNHPKLAEIELRQMLLHVNGYAPHELTPEIVKKKFKRMAQIFFSSAYDIAKARYGFLTSLLDSGQAQSRMVEGVDWYVDTDFNSAKSKLLSLRMLLEMRLYDKN